MTKLALYVPLQAKPGKEQDVADFLCSALPFVNAEPGTISWFAVQEGLSQFAIFGTYKDEAAREAHLNGKVAASSNGKGQRWRAFCRHAGDPRNSNSLAQATALKSPNIACPSAQSVEQTLSA